MHPGRAPRPAAFLALLEPVDDDLAADNQALAGFLTAVPLLLLWLLSWNEAASVSGTLPIVRAISSKRRAASAWLTPSVCRLRPLRTMLVWIAPGPVFDMILPTPRPSNFTGAPWR
mgnify:CR=1 FL=1